MAKILLVDDSSFALDMVARIIEKEGHQTIRASDGEEGLKKIDSEAPDLVVTDLLMPKMDGITFLRAIRKDNQSLPIVILSANIQSSMREKCLEAGASAFLRKPPDRKDLITAIGKLT